MNEDTHTHTRTGPGLPGTLERSIPWCILPFGAFLKGLCPTELSPRIALPEVVSSLPRFPLSLTLIDFLQGASRLQKL